MPNSLEEDKKIRDDREGYKTAQSKNWLTFKLLFQIKLKEHEKIIYQRYVEAEKQEPNFLDKGKTEDFMREVFLFIYLAGHGCADHEQYFLLNE